MRVRMKVEMSGTRNGVPWPARGGEVDLPDGEGAQLCRSGMAEPVAAPEPAERAVAPQPETRAEEPEPQAAPPPRKRAPRKAQ